MAAVSTVTLLAFMAPAPAQAVRAGDAASAANAAATTPAGSGDAVLDVVMLVDESGSETNANVAEERRTAGTIGQTLLNPRSRVTVVGFGGVNHLAPNQDPVNVACQPTIAGGAVHLSYLATCVNSLHRRTPAQGDDTDYAAAFGQAMSYFDPNTAYGRQSPRGAIKVILMMTDGGLDVHQDTQQYGKNWLAGAHHAVNLQLAAARANGVQVWPLGFGTILPSDQRYLGYLAANGAQKACDNRHVSRPHATIVNNPADALRALDSLYAEAGCLGSNSSSVVISGNQTRWLQVGIPPIASDAAISVARGNPGVQLSFYMPDGTQWTNGSALSGTGTPVEVLHVASPQSGQWRIKLTAPPGLASELVRATAFWQGAVNAVMTANPSSAQPGQPINITLSVLGTKGPITDLATLARMQVAVSASGDGLSGPTEIPVSNRGEGQGTATGVGDYKGTFTAPRAQGTLTFTGTAAGYGLYATEIPTTVQVGSGTPAFQSTVQLPAINSVLTGHSIQGRVLFANKTGVAHTVRLSLSVSHAFATITSPSGVIRVPSGNPPATPFTITFAKNSPLGPAFLEIRVVDAANGRTTSVQPFAVTVNSPPTIFDKYRWEIIGAAILLVLLVLLAFRRRRARRDAAKVQGLYAIIRRDGTPVGNELKAPSKGAETFRLVIRDENDRAARLDYPKPEDSPYEVRRGGNGHVTVKTPEDVEYDITVGSAGQPLANGLQLTFRDTRRASGRRASGKRASARRAPVKRAPVKPRSDPYTDKTSGNGSRSQPPDPDVGRAPTPPSRSDDPWLT